MTKGIYTLESSGYQAVVSETPIAYSGGVSVFSCEGENLSVEALRLHGENVASFQLALDGQPWYIVGCCLAPDDASTIENIIAAIIQQLRGFVLLVTRDLNTNLAPPEVHVRDK